MTKQDSLSFISSRWNWCQWLARNRGDKTAIELFVAEVRLWEAIAFFKSTTKPKGEKKHPTKALK
jgi:hypothetical protein